MPRKKGHKKVIEKGTPRLCPLNCIYSNGWNCMTLLEEMNKDQTGRGESCVFYTRKGESKPANESPNSNTLKVKRRDDFDWTYKKHTSYSDSHSHRYRG